MKTYLFIIALSLFLISCHHPEKEKALKDLERCHRKLAGYNEMVSSLTWKLKKLHQQWEEAEDNIVVNVIKEFRIYASKKEREERVHRAFANKEKIENSIEKTILTINHLTDSVIITQAKIRDAEEVINHYEYLTIY